jgi:hypothetical protein
MPNPPRPEQVGVLDAIGGVVHAREIAGFHEHGKFSAITPANLAQKAQRALDA